MIIDWQRLVQLLILTLLFCMADLQAQDDVSIHPLGHWAPVTSKYGYRKNPFKRGRNWQFHKGIDLDTEEGDSVFAWRSGIVIFAGSNATSGNMINLQHPHGYVSKYHHLKKILVDLEEPVEAGQLIGQAGSTGRVTGSHLHFTIMKNGEHEDPFPYLKKTRIAIAGTSLSRARGSAQFKQFFIKTTPPGVQIFIDGEPYGATPTSVLLSFGEHFLELRGSETSLNHTERIWVDEGFNSLHATNLEMSEAAPSEMPAVVIEDEDDAVVNANQGWFPALPAGGFVLNAHLPFPLDKDFETNLKWQGGFDAGLASFLYFPKYWFSNHFLDVRFSMIYGNFEDGLDYYPGDQTEPSFARERLDDFYTMSGTVGYHLAPSISDRFMLQLGGEISYGVMRIRSRTLLDTPFDGEPSATATEGEQHSRQLRFVAPALSGGFLLELQPNLILNARYYHTFFASDTDWYGFRVGILRTIW